MEALRCRRLRSFFPPVRQRGEDSEVDQAPSGCAEGGGCGERAESSQRAAATASKAASLTRWRHVGKHNCAGAKTNRAKAGSDGSGRRSFFFPPAAGRYESIEDSALRQHIGASSGPRPTRIVAVGPPK